MTHHNGSSLALRSWTGPHRSWLKAIVELDDIIGSVAPLAAGVRVADTVPGAGKLCRGVADAGNAALFQVVDGGGHLNPVGSTTPKVFGYRAIWNVRDRHLNNTSYQRFVTISVKDT